MIKKFKKKKTNKNRYSIAFDVSVVRGDRKFSAIFAIKPESRSRTLPDSGILRSAHTVANKRPTNDILEELLRDYHKISPITEHLYADYFRSGDLSSEQNARAHLIIIEIMIIVN